MINCFKIIDNKILFRKLCEVAAPHDQKSHLTQELKTQLLVKNECITLSKVQNFLDFSMINRAERGAEAIAKADPLAKLENPEFTKFLGGEIG